MGDKARIEQQDKLIAALQDCLMIYMPAYKSSGMLSPLTSFTLEIKGPVGKEEFQSLIRRLKMDSQMVGKHKIQFTDAYENAKEYLKQIKELPSTGSEAE